MKSSDLSLLKYFASHEAVSVDNYEGGQCYRIPTAAFLLEQNSDGSNKITELDDEAYIYIDCSYKMQLGMPYIDCEITFEDEQKPMEKISIPMDSRKRNKKQRDVMSLINTCSKNIISREISRTKYAIAAMARATTGENQYTS